MTEAKLVDAMAEAMAENDSYNYGYTVCAKVALKALRGKLPQAEYVAEGYGGAPQMQILRSGIPFGRYLLLPAGEGE